MPAVTSKSPDEVLRDVDERDAAAEIDVEVVGQRARPGDVRSDRRLRVRFSPDVEPVTVFGRLKKIGIGNRRRRRGRSFVVPKMETRRPAKKSSTDTIATVEIDHRAAADRLRWRTASRSRRTRFSRQPELIVRVANWPPTLTFRKNFSVEGVGVWAWTEAAQSARPAHSPRTVFTLAIKLLVWMVRVRTRENSARESEKMVARRCKFLYHLRAFRRPDFLFAWSHCMQRKTVRGNRCVCALGAVDGVRPSGRHRRFPRAVPSRSSPSMKRRGCQGATLEGLEPGAGVADQRHRARRRSAHVGVPARAPTSGFGGMHARVRLGGVRLDNVKVRTEVVNGTSWKCPRPELTNSRYTWRVRATASYLGRRQAR